MQNNDKAGHGTRNSTEAWSEEERERESTSWDLEIQ